MANESLDMNWNPDRPKYAYTVVQRKDGTSRWISIGRAFINRDHSINVLLDATPTNGKLQIREWTPRPEDAKSLTTDERFADPNGGADLDHAVARAHNDETTTGTLLGRF